MTENIDHLAFLLQLCDVISTAYERNSVIVTTNIPFENWTEVLGSERLTGPISTACPTLPHPRSRRRKLQSASCKDSPDKTLKQKRQSDEITQQRPRRTDLKPSHRSSPQQKRPVCRPPGATFSNRRLQFLEVIEKAIAQHNKTIVNATQCNEGMVEVGLYEASSTLLERGVISGLDMTPETAITKLTWTLGTKIGDQRVTQMQVSQRGEQSKNLFDLRYGSCGNESESQTTFAAYQTLDRRFNVGQFCRATVRLSGLGFGNVTWGEAVRIYVFMNLATADAKTPSDHPRCIAGLSFVCDENGATFNPTHVIENCKAASTIGDGDVTLSVVADEGVEFWFDELFLARFAKA